MITFILCVPGLTAARDLALTGDGTPVPLDPPRRLVTHGIYAYISNPMQLSMTLLLLWEGLLLASPWPITLAGLGIIYSEGLARWSESEDMHQRFGQAWADYRVLISRWLPKWHPRVGESCELRINDNGSSQFRRWLERRRPDQLVLLHAEHWQGMPLSNITWRHPVSGRIESGVAAMAMALQHINLAWAFVGWIAGLPGLCQILQACCGFDKSGAFAIRNPNRPLDHP